MDSARFMVSSLSNLPNNFSEGIHKIKCKHVHEDKKCDICGIKYKYYNCFFEYTTFEDDLCRNKNYQRKFDETLKEQFLITAAIILFHKGAYPYK